MKNTLVLSCRGIILDKDEMLVVSHPGADYFALPGGRVNFGENPIACIERELVEELGIKPQIGRLLYINSFVSDDRHTIEFFFEILNGSDYKEWENKDRSHHHELQNITWIKNNFNIKLLPESFANDFKNNALFSNIPKFIK